MRQLTFVKKGLLEWREVAAPRLESPTDAIVRPFVASRCDGDVVFLLHDFSRALSLGAALHVIDPMVHAVGSKPFGGPFAYGHECVAEVVEVGPDVRGLTVGKAVIVPWAVSCGTCKRCKKGLTSKCERNEHPASGYGFGPSLGGWGGMVSDRFRVPYAEHMLVPVPDGVDPVAIAAASDNIPDAWRTVGPGLAADPGAPVLIVGGGAESIGLYAVAIAIALGSSRVDYIDSPAMTPALGSALVALGSSRVDYGEACARRVAIAESLGAHAVRITGRERWYRRGEPILPGGYPVTVDASNKHSGLSYAVRALAPGGTATCSGFYFFKGTPLPLWQMYLNESTFRIGLSNPRADLAHVLKLVTSGQFHPEKITSSVSPWDDAARAFLEPGTKVVVTRPRLHAP